MLGVYVSQVQFSRSWSQDFVTHDRRSQVGGFNSRVPGLRVLLSSQVSGPRVSGLKVPDLGSQVLILDYAKITYSKS